MSNGSPPIIPDPNPPAPGIQQPVYGSGSATAPTAASWFPQTAVGEWMPPPEVGMGGNQPFPTPVVPPGSGISGPNQPQFGSGNATTPPRYFPGYFTTTPPYPPILFANIFNMGNNNPPPSTPSQPPLPPLPT